MNINIPTLKEVHQLFRLVEVMLPVLALVWFVSFSWLLVRANSLAYRLHVLEGQPEDQPKTESESLYE